MQYFLLTFFAMSIVIWANPIPDELEYSNDWSTDVALAVPDSDLDIANNQISSITATHPECTSDATTEAITEANADATTDDLSDDRIQKRASFCPASNDPTGNPRTSGQPTKDQIQKSTTSSIDSCTNPLFNILVTCGGPEVPTPGIPILLLVVNCILGKSCLFHLVRRELTESTGSAPMVPIRSDFFPDIHLVARYCCVKHSTEVNVTNILIGVYMTLTSPSLINSHLFLLDLRVSNWPSVFIWNKWQRSSWRKGIHKRT